MKALTVISAMQLLAKAIKKPCMYIGGWEYYDGGSELKSATPYLEFQDDEHLQILADGNAILVFDSDDEMEKYYNMTVGDDGPTKLNKYNGPCRVYALTCSSKGELLNENT